MRRFHAKSWTLFQIFFFPSGLHFLASVTMWKVTLHAIKISLLAQMSPATHSLCDWGDKHLNRAWWASWRPAGTTLWHFPLTSDTSASRSADTPALLPLWHAHTPRSAHAERLPAGSHLNMFTHAWSLDPHTCGIYLVHICICCAQMNTHGSAGRRRFMQTDSRRLLGVKETLCPSARVWTCLTEEFFWCKATQAWIIRWLIHTFLNHWSPWCFI